MGILYLSIMNILLNILHLISIISWVGSTADGPVPLPLSKCIVVFVFLFIEHNDHRPLLVVVNN